MKKKRGIAPQCSKKKLSLKLHNVGSFCQLHSPKKPSHGDGQAYLASACSPVQRTCQSPSRVRLSDPTDCGRSGSSVQGISPARILEWAAFPFPRGSSRPRDPGIEPRHCRRILHKLRHQGSSCTIKSLGGTTSHPTPFLKGALLTQALLHPSSSSPKSGRQCLCLK